MIAVYKTEIGDIGIECTGNAVTRVLLQCTERGEQGSPIIDLAAEQIKEYLAGERRVFTVPYSFSGTPFQEDVWRALARIPYGETRSYSYIACETGRPFASRAVGGACNKNPLPILIPCHRVIGADGSLTGFALGCELKSRLLAIETGRSE